MIITIDGPAGSGKTSAARMLAQRLGIKVLQTGLLYRAAAYVLLVAHGLVPAVTAQENESYVSRDESMDVRDSVSERDIELLRSIEYGYEGSNIFPYVCISGQRREALLGLGWLSLPASIISQNPRIRAWALQIQRDIAQEYSVVAEGRDCGTVVFPEADYKFFLTASLEARVERIMRDRTRNAESLSRDEASKSISERDAHDENRIVAPLVAASGAVEINSSQLSQEAVVAQMLAWMKDRVARPS